MVFSINVAKMKSLAQIERAYEVCFRNAMKLVLQNEYSCAVDAATLIFGKTTSQL